MNVAALVLAAGRGERLRAELPKAFVPLGGVPLIARAIEALAACPEVTRVVPVIAPADRVRFASLGPRLAAAGKLAAAVEGGAERQDSVRAGLAALPAEVELVAVHDAARALVAPGDVSRVIAAARTHGAALLAVPARDTLKRVRDGKVVETLLRPECWAAQTPQVFRVELLREALAKADAADVVATDDAQLVELLGSPVHVVEGSPENCKITGPEDLVAAEAWLAARSRPRRGA